MSKRDVISRESLKLIWIRAEEDVMKSCFYCRKCAKCSKFYEIMTECKAKGLLSFNKEVKNWEVIFIKKRLQHRCFPVKFAKFSKNTFFTDTSVGCF